MALTDAQKALEMLATVPSAVRTHSWVKEAIGYAEKHELEEAGYICWPNDVIEFTPAGRKALEEARR